MQRFEVIQLREDLWSLISQGQTLSSHETEKEARRAALALAKNMGQSGIQTSIVISPDEMSGGLECQQRGPRFTGM